MTVHDCPTHPILLLGFRRCWQERGAPRTTQAGSILRQLWLEIPSQAEWERPQGPELPAHVTGMLGGDKLGWSLDTALGAGLRAEGLCPEPGEGAGTELQENPIAGTGNVEALTFQVRQFPSLLLVPTPLELEFLMRNLGVSSGLLGCFTVEFSLSS